MAAEKGVNMSTDGTANYGFDCLLIDLVRKNDVLWRKSHLDYHNELAKKKSWEFIAETLHEPAQFCLSRWLSLRTKYVRKLKQFGPTGAGDPSPWVHMEELSFLAGVIKHRQKSTHRTSMHFILSNDNANSSETTNEQTFEQQPTWGGTFPAPEFCVPMPEESNAGSGSEPDIKRLRPHEIDNIGHCEQVMASSSSGDSNDILKNALMLVKLTQDGHGKKTAHEHFCESISLQLHEMLVQNPSVANTIKIKILTFISELTEHIAQNQNK